MLKVRTGCTNGQKPFSGMHLVCSIPVSSREMRKDHYLINQDGICFCLDKDALRQLRQENICRSGYFSVIYADSKLMVYQSKMEAPPIRFRASPLGEGIQKNTAIILDTCYVASLFRSSFNLKDELSGLMRHGEIFVPLQVIEELEIQKNSLRKGDRGALLVPHNKFSELGCLLRDHEWHGGKLSMEPISLHDEYVHALRSTLKDRSSSNNSRVGHADAAICHLSGTLSGLYDRVIVMSEDSDLHLLLSGCENLEIRFESMILHSTLQK
ncbi:MAG: hypothetical protein WC588_04110 [Candidatus Micrarchaeia archaeon]